MLTDLQEAYDVSATLYYGASPLNRYGEKRKNTEWIQLLQASENARFLILANEGFVYDISRTDEPALHSSAVLSELPLQEKNAIFLGVDEEDGDRPYFVIQFSLDPEVLESELKKRGAFEAYGLRGIAMKRAASHKLLGIMAQAMSIAKWQVNHPRCAKCGEPTDMADAGYRRDCPACHAQHFPRTDPAVIMLITKGDKCLMGRPYHLAENVYTTLAGYVEPGETFEDAVRREVFEEAGVKVGSVQYLASQPWPFPSNIMVGFHGEALSTELNIDYDEMEDCQWFTKEETLKMLRGEAETGYICPPDISIAHYLIKLWAES